MSTVSFYRKPLPSPPATAFNSPDGRRLLKEALLDGCAECFFVLSPVFMTQQEPAFCGLASLAMCLNAMGVDPMRQYRGPWRWFEERHLDCCAPLERVERSGITLGQFRCLAACNGVDAEVVRGATLERFRADAEECAASSGGDLVMVLSYSRATFGQTGDGHFSPFGGLHRGEDRALILDVARFKLPPHWVPVELLHRAMQARDPATGRERGYVLLRRRRGAGAPAPAAHRPSLAVPWERMREATALALEAAERSDGGADAAVAVLDEAGLPRCLVERIPGAEEEAAAAEAGLEGTAALEWATRVAAATQDDPALLALTALAVLPPEVWGGGGAAALPEAVAGEVRGLAHQFVQIHGCRNECC